MVRLYQACDHPVLVSKLLQEVLYGDEDTEDDDHASESSEQDELRAELRKIYEQGSRYKSSKLRRMLRILKECEGEKTIVFTYFQDMFKPIHRVLNRANIEWTESGTEFAEDRNCNVLLKHIAAGSIPDLDIPPCNNVVFLETWNQPAEEEIISRVHRINRNVRGVFSVYHLVMKDTIEEMNFFEGSSH
ncbi:hypothetical protein CPC08DRAFT_711657 [Agrocybe pediades]|nr:hypothetical protein CPC08DRAFT_711657 [Agrocybe pediades]